MGWASSGIDGLCLVGGASCAGINDLRSVAGTLEGTPPLVPSPLPFPDFVHHSVVQNESFMYNLWSRIYQSPCTVYRPLFSITRLLVVSVITHGSLSFSLQALMQILDIVSTSYAWSLDGLCYLYEIHTAWFPVLYMLDP